MIDIKKAEEEFRNYASGYDMKESKISMKYYHTFRVEKICEEIAILLGLDEEKGSLAKLIGLLHDIARFEQYALYKTYDDMKSIDHGDLAVEILKKDNYIRRYVKTDEYDNIILKAIKYHNKYSIGDEVNEEENLFCKIIRDADKLDIFYIKVNETLEYQRKEIEEEFITKEVLEQFMAKQSINRKYVYTNLDRLIVLLAFIYDFNFKESYKIIKDNKYIDRAIDIFDFKKQETKNQMELIRKTANDYINNQIEKQNN